jgi:cytochrome P450
MLLVVLSYLPFLLLLSPLLPFVYFLWDRNGLRRFPAPSYAALSSIWRIRHNLAKKHYLAVHRAHEDLGSHVRIAPNHISVLDPRAPYDIYGHGANMLKEGWYDASAGPHRNLSDARDKSEHQAKRKMLAHTFAAKTVLKFEPLLQEKILALRGQLDSHAASGQTVNVRRYLNFFTIDFFGKLLYGAEFGCLERGDDQLCSETKAGHFKKTPFIDSLLHVTVLNTALAFDPWLLPLTSRITKFHPFRKAGRDWEGVVYHNTKKRLAQPSDTEDLFTKLLRDSKGQDLNLSEGEMIAECSTMMNAGTETTTAALTNTIFLLYKHPQALSKLRMEIDTAFPSDRMPDYEGASRLPYLRACIEESLRVRPPSSFGLPRIVPEGGRKIAGQFVPAGVTVSVPTYSLLRDKNAFVSPEEYIPDRWLTNDPEEKRKMNTNHLPFSTGPRACIGRNIAYFEQIVLIATLVKHYDFEMAPDFELETLERFNSNPGEFPVMCKRRV